MPVDETLYPEIHGVVTATIAASGTQSSAVDLYGLQLCAVQMPTAWNTASLTFLVGSTGSATMYDLYNDAGTEYSVSADTSRYIALTPADFSTVRWMKVRSGAAGSAVTQTAARSITLVVRPV